MKNSVTLRDFIKTGTLAGLGLIVGCEVKNRFDIIIKNGIYTGELSGNVLRHNG